MTATAGARRWSRLGSDERRGQILRAARSLFSELPYGAVSTAAIADAAGVTRGLLHHYFGTKRDLYLEAVRDLVGEPAGLPRAGHGAALGWEESVDAWMDMMEADREAWLAATNAGETGRDPEMRAILDRAREATARRVMGVLRLDGAARPEARSLVLAYGRFAEEVTREWLERGRLSRAQARTLLAGSLPLLVDRLLPAMTPGGEPTGEPYTEETR